MNENMWQHWDSNQNVSRCFIKKLAGVEQPKQLGPGSAEVLIVLVKQNNQFSIK